MTAMKRSSCVCYKDELKLEPGKHRESRLFDTRPNTTMFAITFTFLYAIAGLAHAESCWRDTLCSTITEPAFPGPWDQNIFAPETRTVSPVNVLSLANASVISTYPGGNPLVGNASSLVFDFGAEVGGVLSVNYSTIGGSGSMGLAFTEAKDYIGLQSDSSNGKFARGYGDFACDDGALYSDFDSAGLHRYTMQDHEMRGGFRYLTIFLITQGNTTLDVDSVTLEISFQPTWANLRAYQGYFHCNDEELNKIWYSGAYTIQTNAVPVNTGRQVPTLSSGWANNGSLANGTTTIVDGAKRDRAVWPGDMAIAVPSAFYSVGDIEFVRTALQTMYDHQNADGSLPEAGPPLLQQDSDTYHMWTLIGTYYYMLYTNDTAFLDENWPRYERAVEYTLAKVLQPFGLLNVTGTRDWARVTQGGNNTEANVILYHTLVTGAKLAIWQDLPTLSNAYQIQAAHLAENIYTHLWDESANSFRDNATTTDLYPQDANSMALLFGLAAENAQHPSLASRISHSLTRNWTPIGASAPELPNNISPFISSFEIQGHFATNHAHRALDLIRRSWGWYLNHPNGTGSTVVEGYLTNGSWAYRNYRGYAYDGSYVSHSHGWSAGPTSALMNYVVGLRVTERLGSEWELEPQFGDLTDAEGGFTTKLGKFWAQWKIEGDGKGYVLRWEVPAETKGTVRVPALPGGSLGKVSVDGVEKGVVGEDKPFSCVVGGGSGEIVARLI